MQIDWPRFEHEARRVHERYLVEVVEAFGLCPWAKDARLKGHVHVHVTSVTTPDPLALLAAIDRCMQDENTEIGMLLCPLLPVSRRGFRHLAAAVRAAEEQRRPRGEQHFAIADFHPIAAADVTTPEKLVPFLRRAPDPMLQIVRADVLARVRHAQAQGTAYFDPAQLASLVLDQLPAPEPTLAERVAQANLRSVQKRGIERLEAVLCDIYADRSAAYAALGVVDPTHAHISDTASPSAETTIACARNRDEKPESKAGYSSALDASHTHSSLRKCNDI